jgi:acyl-CoA dehydrogenase
MQRSHLEWPFFTPAQRQLSQQLGDWTATHAGSLADEAGDPDEVTRRLAGELGRAGWLRFLARETWGGPAAEIESRNVCLIREALAYHSGIADCVVAIQGLCSVPISLFGTPEQQQTYLPAILSGEKCGSFALSEAVAGSDVSSLATLAREEGDGFVIDGAKTWISHAPIASHHIVFARTGPAPGAKGLSAFVVPADTPGVRITESLDIIAPHSIGSIAFENCRVPRECLIGNIGDGFRIAMSTLDIFRATVGAAALGMARRALDETLAHARKRVVFGQPLASMQATQFRIADMKTEVDTAALLVYRAAWAKDCCDRRVTLESAMAKMQATEAAQRVIDAAVQLHGGLGVTSGSVVERLYREIRPLRIYEGTTEIQKIIISNQVLNQG